MGVFGEAEIVGGAEGSGEDVFGGGGEADVSGAVAAPASVDGEEDVGEFVDEGLLLGGVEHEVAEAFADVSEGGEDAAADAEVDGAHVGGLFGAGEGECDADEVFGSHKRADSR